MKDLVPTEAVKAVIRSEEGGFLFVQRNPEVRDTDSWDLPGGLIENESPEAALKRELDEELGVEVDVGEKVGEWSFYRPLDGKTVRVSNYSCKILKGTVSLSEEHIASKWVTETEAKGLKVKDPSLFSALGN